MQWYKPLSPKRPLILRTISNRNPQH
ncbi:Protein of unknown function [Pyronema omphalodes CBS 100304]|uniref:Uncharacterized protein n=1 Tax=Pyronema omphalodes (strain CBS 100304) TaxID=1076935 RepID=U4L2T1_PYROM|nr:Protein of unknown function [Pyronema omphalodes CBS 100304]